MIQKLLLQSVVSKYFLGENESVKWIIKDNTLTVDFMSPNQEVIGKVKCNAFDLSDSELAIYNTRKLMNLINITNGGLLLELEKQNEMFTKLRISDSNYNLVYALSDPILIGKIGTVNEQEYGIVLRLEKEDIEALIKAKSALVGIDNMKITSTKNLDGDLVCEFIFGDEMGHDNKISYQVRGEISNDDIIIPFNSDMFKTILYSNKDQDYGTLSVSSTGLMNLQFYSKNIKSEYYMIRKAEENF